MQQDRVLSRRGEGLPGYGTVPFGRAMVEHPAGYNPLLAHTSMERIVIAFRENRTLGIREDDRFRGRSPMAHTFACLRIAALVSKNGARLATGSGGLTLGRMGFAPTGRCTKFHGGNASSNSLRPAGPGRTIFPIRSVSAAVGRDGGPCYGPIASSSRRSPSDIHRSSCCPTYPSQFQLVYRHRRCPQLTLDGVPRVIIAQPNLRRRLLTEPSESRAKA